MIKLGMSRSNNDLGMILNALKIKPCIINRMTVSNIRPATKNVRSSEEMQSIKGCTCTMIDSMSESF